MIYDEEIPKYNPFDNPKDRKEIIDTDKLFNQCEVSIDEVIKHPPTAIAIGEYEVKGNMYPIPFGSYGDFSCIVGASKSKKTFLKSALLAGYIGGSAVNYFNDIRGIDNTDKWVIDIDTEQSKFHSQRVFRRVQEMTGIKHDKYKAFFLREQSVEERLALIESIFENPLFKNNIGLVAIDGFADLVKDFNSLEESTQLTQKIMKWSSVNKCHIIGVLHSNFNTKKPTGHLGSSVMKKAETVVILEPGTTEKSVMVNCSYSRNHPFKDFEFELNKDYLPFEINGSFTFDTDKAPF